MKLQSKESLVQTLAQNFKLLLSYALGLVSALAWNDAIQSLIKSLFPKESVSSVLIKFIYAVVITLIAVIVIFSLDRIRLHSRQTKK